MDQFPDNFNDAYLRQIRQEIRDQQESEQAKLLKKTRDSIYRQIENDIKDATKDFTILQLPDELNSESKKVLINELNQKFSNIEYVYAVAYADYEAYKPLNRENPQISYEYKINFPKC